jgi:membrane-associated phospholipid phosphatase
LRFHQKINAYFERRPEKDRLVRHIGLGLTALFYASYAALCIWLWLTDREKLKRVLAVPAACYISGSLIRKAINSPRPADRMPEMKRESAKKGGKSFPSRHCFSAAVIAAAFAWIDPRAGLAAGIAAAAMAAERVLEGAHFVWDAAAGLAYGALCGWIGFFAYKK